MTRNSMMCSQRLFCDNVCLCVCVCDTGVILNRMNLTEVFGADEKSFRVLSRREKATGTQVPNRRRNRADIGERTKSTQ